MAGRLVVVREPVARVADPHDTAGVPRPAGGRAGPAVALAGGRRGGRQVLGPRGVGPEDVLDVHEQELLMLLLVVEAQLDQVGHRPLGAPVEEPEHRLVDRGAVVGDRGRRRAG